MLLSVIYIVSRQENLSITISDFVVRSNRQQQEIRKAINEIVKRLALLIPPPNYKSIILRYSSYLTIDHDLYSKMVSFTSILINFSSEILLEAEPEDFVAALICYFSFLTDRDEKSIIEFTKELPVTSELNVIEIFTDLKEKFSFLKSGDLLNLAVEEFEQIIIRKLKVKECEKFKPIIHVDSPTCLLCYFRTNEKECPLIRTR